MSTKKVTTPMLADRLALSAGVSKKAAESFLRAFTETIIAGTTNSDSVKIKDFGSFKMVKVADRASVDVNTGERIVIPGYNKLSFSPDANIARVMADYENNKPTISSPQTETATTIAEETPAVVEKTSSVVEVTVKEEPAPTNDQPLKDTAKEKEEAEKTEEIAAQTEVATTENASTTEEKSSASPLPAIEESLKKEPASTISTPKIPQKSIKFWCIIGAAVLLITVLLICLLSANSTGSSTNNNTSTTSQPTNYVVPANIKQNHRTHILQKGESLTTLSIHYYNTIDSLESICKLNGFDKSTNIPVGTEIVLP